MKLVKEDINEKFTEDSDPIKDLGIGDISKIADKILKSMPEESCQTSYDKYFKQYGDVDFFSKNKYYVTCLVRIHWFTLQEIRDHPYESIDFYNAKFELTYKYEFSGEAFSQRAKKKILDKVIKIIKSQIGIKLSYEMPLLEKFEEISDPVSDLGIEHPFTNLKLGDILVVKKEVAIEFTGGFNNDFKFLEIPGKEKFRVGCAGFIKEIKKINDDFFLKAAFFPNKESAISASKENFHISFYTAEGTASYETWAEFFDIVKL